MKLEHFTDGRGILIWVSPKILNFDYKYLLMGSIMPGETRGNHYHKRIFEKILCIKGTILVRVGLKENEISNGEIIDITTGELHSVTNIGDEEAFFIEFKSEELNEADRDTHKPNN